MPGVYSQGSGAEHLVYPGVLQSLSSCTLTGLEPLKTYVGIQQVHTNGVLNNMPNPWLLWG